METRKVYKSGGSTLVVSLPKRWAKKVGVKEGDSVMVTELEGSLRLSAGEPEKPSPKAIIDSSQLESREDLKLLLISFYLAGYERVVVRFDEERRLDYKKDIRDVIGFLMGLEIAEEYGNHVMLEVLLDQERISTTQALRRMYLIIHSMLKDAVEVIENGDTDLAMDIIAREKEIDRLYFLVVRQLKSAVRYSISAERLGIKEQREPLGFRIVVKSFERISDHIENLILSYLELLKDPKSIDLKNVLKIMESVIVLLEDSSKSVFNKDQRLALSLFRPLDDIKKRHQLASNRIFAKELSLQAAIYYKGMLDSMLRIADYSSDIAEIAINMSVRVP
jgi:phosphate uptake regulator